MLGQGVVREMSVPLGEIMNKAGLFKAQGVEEENKYNFIPDQKITSAVTKYIRQKGYSFTVEKLTDKGLFVFYHLYRQSNGMDNVIAYNAEQNGQQFLALETTTVENTDNT